MMKGSKQALLDFSSPSEMFYFKPNQYTARFSQYSTSTQKKVFSTGLIFISVSFYFLHFPNKHHLLNETPKHL